MVELPFNSVLLHIFHSLVTDIILDAWNWPWSKYLHYRNRQIPSRKLAVNIHQDTTISVHCTYNHLLYEVFIEQLLIVSPFVEYKLPERTFCMFTLISPEPRRVSGTETMFKHIFCMKAFYSVTYVWWNSYVAEHLPLWGLLALLSAAVWFGPAGHGHLI